MVIQSRFDFDIHDRDEVAQMKYEIDTRLQQGEIITKRYFVEEGRLSYREEKRQTGQIPDGPSLSNISTKI